MASARCLHTRWLPWPGRARQDINTQLFASAEGDSRCQLVRSGSSACKRCLAFAHENSRSQHARTRHLGHLKAHGTSN